VLDLPSLVLDHPSESGEGLLMSQNSRMMRVYHVSPTYFAPESVIGGGERFVEELARAMSRHCYVKLVSFGPRSYRQHVSIYYKKVILKNWTKDRLTPFSPRLFLELKGAQVIHCHQYHTLPTFLAILWGRLHGIPVFVTDLGGGGWTPAYHIDQSRWIAAHLPISQYASRVLPGRNGKFHIIYGGVDLPRWQMRKSTEHDGAVVFLGRILPHKGIHFLIQGLPELLSLKIIGSMTDNGYYTMLREMAFGKRVQFLQGLEDSEVQRILQRAMAIVHPTPVNADGSPGANELFGLAVAEAMACGCVPVVPAVGPWPELVEHEVSGVLIPPNDPVAIRDALERLYRDFALWSRLSEGARQRIEQYFTWDRVVERCFEAYQMFGNVKNEWISH